MILQLCAYLVKGVQVVTAGVKDAMIVKVAIAVTLALVVTAGVKDVIAARAVIPAKDVIVATTK